MDHDPTAAFYLLGELTLDLHRARQALRRSEEVRERLEAAAAARNVERNDLAKAAAEIKMLHHQIESLRAGRELAIRERDRAVFALAEVAP